MPAEKLRILFTAHRFLPHIGGVEMVVAHLARRLAARGHDVTVATRWDEGLAEEETRDGYRIRRFPLKAVGKFHYPPRAYREFVLSDAWDVVHVHGQRLWSTDFLYPHFRKAHAPVVFTAHGFYQWHVERTPVVDQVYYRGVLPRALRHAAVVTALTQGEVEELADFGVPRSRVRLVPDGYDAAEAAPDRPGLREDLDIPVDAPVLLYVGGYYPNKRVPFLVDAVARAGTPATLVVVGKDADPVTGRAHCEALARERGVNLVSTGTIPREDVLALYRDADLFLLASDFEGFGLVLLEAMAAGLPFVATPAGAAPDLAVTGAGRVAATPAEMGDAIRDLLGDADARARMAADGRDAVRAYDWDRVTDQYEALFREVARA